MGGSLFFVMCFVLLHAIQVVNLQFYTILGKIMVEYLKKIYIKKTKKKSEFIVEKIIKRFTFGRGGGVLKRT